MKIVMLCDLYDESLQYQENLLAKYYIKHNHEVTVIASTFISAFEYMADKYNKNTIGQEYICNGIKIIKRPYSINVANKLRRLKNVWTILQYEQPDLIFVHDIHLNLTEVVRYKKHNSNCKIIMDYHADYSNSAKNWVSLNILHKTIRKLFFYGVKKYIDKLYYVTPASGRFLHEVYGISYNEMDLLPLGSDTDLVNETKRSNIRQKIRDKYRISNNEIVIFTGGKLTPAKKTHHLIEAFRKISDSNLHLIIVGAVGEEQINYKNHLSGLSKDLINVHLVGWVNSHEVYGYLAASDIAIFPASQSILWQQAISMGLPLMVGQVGDQSISYLNKYSNIIILKENEINTDNIVQEICNLIRNEQQMNAMRIAALKTTDEFLNYDTIILKTLKF